MELRTYDAIDENLHDVLAFIEEGLDAHECNMKTSISISVAVEEMYVNIAHYAYEPFNCVGKATVGLDFVGDDVLITLIDEGIEFNPLEKEDPDISLEAKDRDIGGLGIYMVKKTMDECTYKREDGKNIFTMRKNIR